MEEQRGHRISFQKRAGLGARRLSGSPLSGQLEIFEIFGSNGLGWIAETKVLKLRNFLEENVSFEDSWKLLNSNWNLF